MDDMPPFDGSETKFGDIDKPVVTNRPSKISNNVKKPIKNTKVFRVAAKIKNFLANDCNAGKDIVKPKDFDVKVNSESQDIRISANGQGKICLNTIDESWVRDIITNENEHNFKITIKKNT